MKPFKNPELYLTENRTRRIIQVNLVIVCLNLITVTLNVIVLTNHLKGFCQ